MLLKIARFALIVGLKLTGNDMKYNIKFTLGSKKMQMIIKAQSANEAEYLLRGKIKIDSIIEVESGKNLYDSDILEFLKGFKK